MSQELDIEQIVLTLSQALSDVTAVKVRHFFTSDIFALRFMENFLSDTPGALSQNQAASQSNWTYNTAISVKNTASQLGLNCIFEAMGRLDAVISTYDDEPEILLFAEWEAKHKTVFGQGKELDKLWQNASQHEKADAFLFTYCPEIQYTTFLKSVAADWQGKESQSNRRPILYLITWVYERVSNIDRLQYMSTIEIHQGGVKVWGDLRSANAIF